MGRAIDAAGIQYRTLNSSKGPAVRASRAQADRVLYKKEILRQLEGQDRVSIIEGEVTDIEVEQEQVRGVRLADGARINAAAVALHARLSVEEFSQSDLAYAPPFGPTWDPLLTAANQLLKAM